MIRQSPTLRRLGNITSLRRLSARVAAVAIHDDAQTKL
jgi:hypothetical protein